jgi:hypothetical protein
MSVVKFPKKYKAELDLDSLRLSPEHLAAIAETKAKLEEKGPRTRPTQGKDFLHEPMARLAIGLNAGGGTVWAYLLQQARMRGSSTVPVANLMLSRLGVSRKVKQRALDRLEAAKLIDVRRRPRRSPLVTVKV